VGGWVVWGWVWCPKRPFDTPERRRIIIWTYSHFYCTGWAHAMNTPFQASAPGFSVHVLAVFGRRWGVFVSRTWCSVAMLGCWRVIGRPLTHSHYTPHHLPISQQWNKQIASHFGGVRNPMVISWPKGIKEDVHGQVCDVM
jgi:hypothetical protein